MTETPDAEGDILKASSPGQGQIEIGMDVVSVDGQPLGRVKEVRGSDFLLDRPMARDMYVPFNAILATPHGWEKYRGGPTEPTEVVLSVSAAHIDMQSWPEG